MVEHAHLPGTRDAQIDRCEAVYGDQDGFASVAFTPRELLAYPIVIGPRHSMHALLGLLAREVLIARNDGALALHRDRVRSIERTVTVDHQTRVALKREECAQLVRQTAREARGTD